jgi:hypothetical protein
MFAKTDADLIESLRRQLARRRAVGGFLLFVGLVLLIGGIWIALDAQQRVTGWVELLSQRTGDELLKTTGQLLYLLGWKAAVAVLSAAYGAAACITTGLRELFGRRKDVLLVQLYDFRQRTGA